MSNAIDADMADVAAAAFTTYFTNQEPIDGTTLTVVDLTAASCRWQTGNPTFRYCGKPAHGGPYCARHARLVYLPRAA